MQYVKDDLQQVGRARPRAHNAALLADVLSCAAET
jgi:hypothetical protein